MTELEVHVRVFLAAMLKHACNLDFIQMVKTENGKAPLMLKQ